MKIYLSLFSLLFLASSISFGYLVPGPGSGGGPNPPGSKPNPPQYQTGYPNNPETGYPNNPETPDKPPAYPYDDGGYSAPFDTLEKCSLYQIVNKFTGLCTQSKGVGDQVDDLFSLFWRRPQYLIGRPDSFISHSADILKNFLPLQKQTRFFKVGMKIKVHFESPEEILQWQNQIIEYGNSWSSLETQEGAWPVIWNQLFSLERDEVTCIYKKGSRWNYGTVILNQFIHSSDWQMWTCKESNSKVIRNTYYVTATINNGKGIKIDQNSNLILKLPFPATIVSVGAVVRERR
ncbi:MAG: hypothetical protein ACK5P5_08735 [Pseudobdellovibrionaceae bacterium]